MPQRQHQQPSVEPQRSFLALQARHVRQCRWEAIVVVAIWLVGLVWCCGVLVGTGYVSPQERPEEPSLVWGIPSWVFWGLFFPWFWLILATWWFALFVLKDDQPYIDMPPSDDDSHSNSD